MPFGLNMSLSKMQQTELHPADKLFYWLTGRVADSCPVFSENIKFVEVREKLHELYDAGRNVEFVKAVLNRFAVNIGNDGETDWRDYFSDDDIEKWLKEYKDGKN